MNNTDHTQLKTPRQSAVRAFTLIELLIVIALTAILLTLLIVPLISALRYTQQAQIVTAAQDAARVTKERITRELGGAVFVFDGTSHPFQTSNTIAAGDDKYTNFLDLEIPGITLATGAYKSTVAHAYNAKIDFVLPKLNDDSGKAAIDPTTNEPIAYTQSQNGSAIISNPSFVFPLAAGTTAIRYFIGLKDPTKPYNNTREGKSNSSTDNTYILYRAEYQPYLQVKNTAGAATGVTPNLALFATRNNSSGVSIPELDDPDFFRYVGTNDTDWLDDTHTTYGATTLAGQDITSHNNRVDKWIQIAKPVIPGPNVDLILLPHNADNTLAYDSSTGAFPGVAHSGVATDPVTTKTYPIVNTSVTFRPATISGNAAPGTTSDYNTQGVVSVDQTGYTYIPTVYTATSQSWSLPFHVGVYPSNYGTANASMYYYDTDQWAAGSPSFTPAVTGISINPGDVIEYRTDGTSRVPVYNVTQGFPYTVTGTAYTVGGKQFVPMTINPDTGTIAFTAPSLPNGPGDRLTRPWPYYVLDTTSQTTANKGGVDPSGNLDLTLPASAPAALTDSPLQGFHALSGSGTPPQTGTENARIAPGSVRVTGPDVTPGPNYGQIITYNEVSSSAGVVSDNQFAVDYLHNTLQFASDLPAYLMQNRSQPIQVIYDYQANLTLTDTGRLFEFSRATIPASTTATGTDNLYQPMQVKVDYQTRDLIDVNIGVRIYDVTTNRAQVIPTETKIKIGNSNR